MLRLVSSWFKRPKKSGFYTSVQQITHLPPKDLSLYELAFRHSSASEVKGKTFIQNNQRLEFLGDSVLGYVVADVLYHLYPTKDEGFLTSMRSKVVSRRTLNRIGKEMELSKLIISNLDKHKVAKSLSGDVLEALIGAVLLDHGYEKCRLFIEKVILDKHLSMSELESAIFSYKSYIIEYAQKSKIDFTFKLLKEEGKNHNLTFTIALYLEDEEFGVASGASKKLAEEAASKLAYDKLQGVHGREKSNTI